MIKTKICRVSRIWHRRAGIISSLVVIFLSVTGILLNHTSELGLGGTSVKSSALLKAYGQSLPKIRSVPFLLAGELRWLSDVDNELFVDDHKVYRCSGALIGATLLGEDRSSRSHIDGSWVLGCESALLILSYDLSIIDIIDSTYGLPEPILALKSCQGSVCVRSELGDFKVDLDALRFTKVAEVFDTPVFEEAPEEIRLRLISQFNGGGVSWERVILDIHAGRFMGALGPWIMDAFAILFIFLAITGLYVWVISKQSRKPHRKRS